MARGRPRGAEEELRRAEQVALDHGPWSPLIDIYTRLGGVRCRAPGEETDHACQFFEEALALCRTFAAPPPLEADVCQRYAALQARAGRREEAKALLHRAYALLDTSGHGHRSAAVSEALRDLER
ncbi:MAG TPA: hypothetical protein VFS07_09445 [Gemmatimonadales bacterium]|nr:hypothetical protein [Gemmatimonadales bacterium]